MTDTFDLAAARARFPEIDQYIRRASANTYEKFIDILYEDLLHIVRDIEENPQLRMSDKEDRVTIEIVTNLKRLSYNAGHDTMAGGHADIVVQKGQFRWIAEAKIANSYAWLRDGLAQLIHRYSSGTPANNHGALLIYLKRPNALKRMGLWLEHLKKYPELDIEYPGFTHTEVNNDLCFETTCQHPRSGLDFVTRHIALSLYSNPIK